MTQGSKTEQALSGPASTARLIDTILALLPAVARNEAAGVLNQDNEATIQMLADILVAERNRRGRLFLCWTAAGAAAVAAGIGSAPYWAPEWHAFTAAAAGAALLAAAPFTRLPGSLEKAALALAVESKQTAVIGALLEGSLVRPLPESLSRRIEARLVAALESMTPADAAHLTPRLRTLLYRNLGYFQRDNNPALRLASIRALTAAGNSDALGPLYVLAAGEAATHTATLVRAAAQEAVEEIGRRLNFGPISLVPEYTERLIRQMQAEGIDYQAYAHSMIALRRLLPQIDSANFSAVLSKHNRERLYFLLTMPQAYSQHRYGTGEMQEEILGLARRTADTLAASAVRRIAFEAMANPVSLHVRGVARETWQVLEAEANRVKESKTLLRGAVAPAAPLEHLLRAASPAPSAVSQSELLRGAAAGTDALLQQTALADVHGHEMIPLRTDAPPDLSAPCKTDPGDAGPERQAFYAVECVAKTMRVGESGQT